MKRRTSIAAFVCLAALWGASYPAIKAGLEGFPPLLFAAVRFDAIAVLVLGYVVATREFARVPAVRSDGGRVEGNRSAADAGAVERSVADAGAVERGVAEEEALERSGTAPNSTEHARIVPTREDLPGVLVGGALLVGIHNGLLFTGQGYVTSAIGAVVLSTVPLLSAAFALPVLPDERIASRKLAGILLGLIGVAIVANPDVANLLSPDLVGVGLLLASAAAFALGAVFIRRSRTDLPVAAMQGWMMLVGAAVLHVGSVALGEPQAVDWSLEVVLAYLYLVPLAGAVGYLLYFALLDALGPVEINLVGYVAPVFAALVGWALLGEPIAVHTWLGFGVICVGFVLVKRRALAREFG